MEAPNSLCRLALRGKWMWVIYPQLWAAVHLNQGEGAVPNEVEELWAMPVHSGPVVRSRTAPVPTVLCYTLFPGNFFSCLPYHWIQVSHRAIPLFPHVHWRHGGKGIVLSKVLHRHASPLSSQNQQKPGALNRSCTIDVVQHCDLGEITSGREKGIFFIPVTNKTALFHRRS